MTLSEALERMHRQQAAGVLPSDRQLDGMAVHQDSPYLAASPDALTYAQRGDFGVGLMGALLGGQNDATSSWWQKAMNTAESFNPVRAAAEGSRALPRLMTAPLADAIRSQDREAIDQAGGDALTIAGLLPMAGVAARGVARAVPKNVQPPPIDLMAYGQAIRDVRRALNESGAHPTAIDSVIDALAGGRMTETASQVANRVPEAARVLADQHPRMADVQFGARPFEPDSFRLPDGMTLDLSQAQPSSGNILINSGDRRIGNAGYRTFGNAAQISHLLVDPEFRGQGLASAMENLVGARTGKYLTPDEVISSDELARWEKRRPGIKSEYRPIDDRYWERRGLAANPDDLTTAGILGAMAGPDGQGWEAKLRPAGEFVDGRRVRDHVPNMESIGATFEDYNILPGIREVPLSVFHPEYKPSNTSRVRNLAAEIKESGEINPLIVAIDRDGPWILEGAHRFDALIASGANSFPAKVVVDLSANQANLTTADILAALAQQSQEQREQRR